MPKILSLNPHLHGLPVWKDVTVAVASLAPGFHGKCRLRKALTIRRVAREFDLVVALNDLWLAAICRFLLPRHVQTAFLGFYYDASSPATGLRRAKYRLLAGRLDRIVVHRSAEAGLYAESLGDSPHAIRIHSLLCVCRRDGHREETE